MNGHWQPCIYEIILMSGDYVKKLSALAIFDSLIEGKAALKKRFA